MKCNYENYFVSVVDCLLNTALSNIMDASAEALKISFKSLNSIKKIVIFGFEIILLSTNLHRLLHRIVVSVPQ